MAFASVMSGCYNTRKVTSYNQYYAETLGIQDKLLEMGFELSGTDTKTNNNVYVSAVSFSNKTGYGTALDNDYMTTDKYMFTSSDGNTLSYSVSYKLNKSSDSVLFVSNITVPYCETSAPKDYSRMCGNNSPIRDIVQMPPNTSVKIFDKYGTYALFEIVVTMGTLLLIYWL